MNEMNLVLLAFSVVSQLVTTVVIVMHIAVPKLRKHPGQYVLIQCCCQFVYDFHWVIAFFTVASNEISNQACEFIGITVNFATNIGLMFTLALSIELLIKLKDISNIAYYKRNIFYYIFSLLIASFMFVLLYFSGTYGKSEIGTCSITGFPALYIQNSLRILFLFLFIIMISLLLKHSKDSSFRLMSHYSLIITFVLLTWCIPGMLILTNVIYDCPYCQVIATALGTLSGTLVGIPRMADKVIYRELKKKCLSEDQKQQLYLTKRFVQTSQESLLIHNERLLGNESLIGIGNSVHCFSDLFKSLLVKSKLEILSSLYLFFSFPESEREVTKKTRGFILQGQRLECLTQFFAESEVAYCKGYIVNNAGIFLLEYKCEYFYNIRKRLGYSNEDFIDSLADQFKVSYSQARVIQNESSNSMIIFTSDSRFVIKTISVEEKRVFFRFLLESYYKRVMDCPNSKLIRILGIFKLLPSKITFIVMENSNPFKEPFLVFDLKGSSIDRLTKTKADLSSAVLKDENLLKLGRKIKLSSGDVSDLLWTIKYDLEILRDIGIMDYSILLIAGKSRGTSNRYSIGKDYTIAVIDLFQIYNSRKVLERFFKVCLRRVDRNKLSSVSPSIYYNRILSFLEGLFTDTEDYDLSDIL